MTWKCEEGTDWVLRPTRVKRSSKEHFDFISGKRRLGAVLIFHHFVPSRPEISTREGGFRIDFFLSISKKNRGLRS